MCILYFTEMIISLLTVAVCWAGRGRTMALTY
jgi:hypothetical protein